MIWRLFIMLAFATVWASNISEIHITDESGAPFPNVLVIIKSLDDNVEVGRYISDCDGQIPPINFSHSLYRVIATCPYGLCRTTVRESPWLEYARRVDIEGSGELFRSKW